MTLTYLFIRMHYEMDTPSCKNDASDERPMQKLSGTKMAIT